MFKRLLLTALLLAGMFVPLLAYPAVPAYAADPRGEVCKGIDAATGSGECQTDVSLTRVVQNIVNILSVVVGIIAVIMIIWGGLKFVTSSGDSTKITSAKHTVIYAIIGLAVVALSQVIVRFVLDNIS